MNEPNVNVAVLSDSEINFELHGFYEISGSERVYSGSYTAKIENKSLVIMQDGNYLNVENEIVFSPRDFEDNTFVIKNVLIGKKFHWEQRQKQAFQGSLKILKDKDQILGINIIPAEDYLKSVISSEMSSDASEEFLKAHAIISRGWIIAQLNRQGTANGSEDIKTNNADEYITWYDHEDHNLFDVCADDHCQRYQGMSRVFNSAVIKAVKDTYGLVLFENNKICDTRFSKCCGGISEAFENVWQPEKYNYLQSIVDYKFEPDGWNLDFSHERNAEKWIKSNPPAFCNCKEEDILQQVLVESDQITKDFYRWTVEYTQEEISNLIKEKSGFDFGEIIELIPVERGDSARIIKLKIVGSKETKIIGKELEIRRILSKSHLYSAAIVFEKFEIQNGVPQKFKIYGAGWGHGVGLCQIGAAVMGDKGYMFDEILVHYFRNSQIKNLY